MIGQLFCDHERARALLRPVAYASSADPRLVIEEFDTLDLKARLNCVG